MSNLCHHSGHGTVPVGLAGAKWDRLFKVAGALKSRSGGLGSMACARAIGDVDASER